MAAVLSCPSICPRLPKKARQSTFFYPILIRTLTLQPFRGFRQYTNYNKEVVRDGYVDIRYINTAYNISDACTKALAKNKISLFEPALHGHEVIDVDLIA